MTHKQAATSGAFALVTLAACAASFFVSTPNELATCALVAIAGLAAFAIAMGDEDA